MHRKWFAPVILVAFFVVLAFPSILTFAQDPDTISTDLDTDGLVNSLETTGWFNQSGGPFVTDPADADTDDDGLSDGEEQAFGTNPLDAADPGLYARYHSELKTIEYFRASELNDDDYLSIKRAGEQYLMTDAVVARRGSTLFVGGHPEASIALTSDGLTDFGTQINRNAYAGGWELTLPSNGTVGTYTITLTYADQTWQMPLYVIFAIPETTIETTAVFSQGLSSADIEAFLYNDDPDDLRDETAVTWRTNFPAAYGHAQAFWTDQYKKYVFVDRVMPRLQGITTPKAAINQLATQADEDVRVNYYNYVPTNMFISLLTEAVEVNGETKYTQIGTPCQNQSGAFTSYLRSAGIPARPFIVDWTATTVDDDHAVLVWNDTDTIWEAARSYRGGEDGNSRYTYYPFSNGITGRMSLYNWGRTQYRDRYGDVVMTVSPKWDYEVWNTSPQFLISGMVGTFFPPDSYMTIDALDYRWLVNRPFLMEYKSPHAWSLMTWLWTGSNQYIEPAWKVAGWPSPTPEALEAAGFDFTGHPNYPTGPYDQVWLVEPEARFCAIGFTGDCPYNRAEGSSITDGVEPVTFEETTSTRLGFGDVLKDYGLDLDGDGRFDQLVFDVVVDVEVAGRYRLGGMLAFPQHPDGFRPAPWLTSEYAFLELETGEQVISLVFDAAKAASYRVDGPYVLEWLWASLSPDFDIRLAEQPLLMQQVEYSSAAYTLAGIEGPAARLAGGISHTGQSLDRDAAYEALEINIPLTIIADETLYVAATLFDATGRNLGQDTWQGQADAATLSFNIAGARPPFQLEKLRLYDAHGMLIDSAERMAYEVDDLGNLVDLGPANLVSGLQSGIVRTDLPDDLGLTHQGIDLDGDSLFDHLQVSVKVNVTVADQYRLAAWLVAADGTPVQYSLGNFANYNLGLRTLSLNFDTRAIQASGVEGPYRLAALTLFDDDGSYSLVDSLQTLDVDLDYNLADFEPISDATIVFSDDLEDGTGNWVWSAPWAFTQQTWPYSNWVWAAEGAQSGTVFTPQAIDASALVGLQLRFKSSTDLDNSETGRVEALSGSGSWTSMATYQNEYNLGQTRVLDLGTFDKSPSLKLRFATNTATDLNWYVDDIVLSGLPGVTGAAIANTNIVAGQETLFTATYESLDTSLPVTYTWDFGDGTPPLMTTEAAVAHTYIASISPTVQLTVENPYDSFSTSRFVGVGQPVDGTEIQYPDAIYETGDSIEFEALVLPVDADGPFEYQWSFGDGTVITDTSATVSHSYAQGGSYIVQLTTIGKYGSANDSQVIEIEEGVSGVGFSVSPAEPTQYEPFAVTAAISEATASQPVTFTWTFDDGTITTTLIPAVEHTFNTPGAHEIQVSADNGYGTGPVSQTQIVNVLGIPITDLDVAITQDNFANEREAVFTINYLPLEASTPITYNWAFGDGTVTTTQNLSVAHIYAADDIYTVHLTASNGHGSPEVMSFEAVVPLNTDGDSLSNVFELTVSGTDPNDADSDDDGLLDDFEYNGFPYTNTLTTSVLFIKTDPNVMDTDGDGLNDGDEWLLGSNPLVVDTDGDSLTDTVELGSDGIYVTNAVNPDTDGDGLSDFFEVGGDPINPVNTILFVNSPVDALNSDDDEDTILTLDEDADPNADGNPIDARDTDLDGQADYQDADDDNDTIPSLDEGLVFTTTGRLDLTRTRDTDGDGVLDYLDADDDGDGVLTRFEGISLTLVYSFSDYVQYSLDVTTSLNSDQDDLLNYRDADDDGDGIPTRDENPDPNGDGNPADALDSDGDTVPDYLDAVDDDGPTADPDNDGLTNAQEAELGTSTLSDDSDGDGLSDLQEVGNDLDNPVDTDGDGIIDALESDDDGDGLATEFEGVDPNGDGNPDDAVDSDSDGTPDYLDDDDDGDGIPTSDENADPNDDGNPDDAADTDGDGTPDYLDTDISDGPQADPDNDGLTNAQEAVAGTNPNLSDSDEDGVPDLIEVGPDPSNPPNTDGDSLIDALDPEDDGDRVPTAAEDLDGDGDPTNDDTDNDGTPNYLDNDDDGDGVPGEDVDRDGDPRDDDSDNDGIPNYLDSDDDGDSVLTIDEDIDQDGNPANDDTDGDGVRDYLDIDDDGDSIHTIFEGPMFDFEGNPGREDTDSDLIPNYLDADDDGDNVPTADEQPDPNSDGNPADAVDGDGDGLVDYLDLFNLDGPDADADGDGLINSIEDALGILRNNPDTDADGVFDGEEVGPNIGSPRNTDGDVQIDAKDPDDDNDGLQTRDEDVDGNGDPLNDDTDGDGTPNFRDADDDGDGVLTADETSLGTNPISSDSDGDGVLDGDEIGADVDNPVNTDGDELIDALDPDDDGDGVPTAEEDVNGDGNPANDDSDGDGIPDYLDQNDTDGPLADPDSDGLSNAQEAALGTNPDLADSDADGVPDAEEVGDDLENPINTDGDDLINALDPDDDNDGIPTIDEDANGNGYPGDDLDPNSGQPLYLVPFEAPSAQFQILLPIVIR